VENFFRLGHTRHTFKGTKDLRDSREIDKNIIFIELKHQQITEVKKILKKENRNLKKTGLIILTFNAISFLVYFCIFYPYYLLFLGTSIKLKKKIGKIVKIIPRVNFIYLNPSSPDPRDDLGSLLKELWYSKRMPIRP